MSASQNPARNISIDAIKTIAILGTILIHVTANKGFLAQAGSLPWTGSLFWGTCIRCAVPLFFMCSGALLLPPQKEISIKTVWKKYILRILVALLFWATAYAACNLVLLRLNTGAMSLADVRLAFWDLIMFRHEKHFYYLHIIVLVYAVLPVTRTFIEHASQKVLRYTLGVWFVLSSLYPTVRSIIPGLNEYSIPAQYVINITWGAVGLGVLGYVMSQKAKNHKPWIYALVYLAGMCITFGGSYLMSVRVGWFEQQLVQGSALGVYLQAIGIFGFCTAVFSRKEKAPVLETVSNASFCIYLVHLFFLGLLDVFGFNAANYNPWWSVPAIAAVVFAGSYACWLVLKRIPIVNRWLI